MNRRSIHPTWCAQDDACTTNTATGEHRSLPLAFHLDRGRIAATRIQTLTGRDCLELHAVLTLPTDPDAARDLTRRLAGSRYLTMTNTRDGAELSTVIDLPADPDAARKLVRQIVTTIGLIAEATRTTGDTR